VQIAYHVTFTRQRPALFCSLEMTRNEIGYRVLARRTGANTKALRAGRHPGQMGPALQALATSGFHIIDPGGPTLTSVQATIRRAVAKHRAEVAIVDHIGKIQADRRESRYLEVGDVSHGLKAIAKQLNIPVLVLVQLNRAVEKRNSPRPQLSDLRDSGRIPSLSMIDETPTPRKLL